MSLTVGSADGQKIMYKYFPNESGEVGKGEASIEGKTNFLLGQEGKLHKGTEK